MDKYELTKIIKDNLEVRGDLEIFSDEALVIGVRVKDKERNKQGDEWDVIRYLTIRVSEPM